MQHILLYAFVDAADHPIYKSIKPAFPGLGSAGFIMLVSIRFYFNYATTSLLSFGT